MPEYVAGVDEAGRGPLAGPVVVAAVVLNPDAPIAGLGDSKALSERRREHLFPLIQARALAWHIEFVSAAEIDDYNILQATLRGMARAVNALSVCISCALIDGNQVPKNLNCPARAIVRGDASEPAIMAASILAKVARDRHMQALHSSFPDYGFAVHKGYPTPAHLAVLAALGPCPEHRRSFAPVRKALAR